MEFLIKLCIRLIKVVYAIIEGVIRALLDVLISSFVFFLILSSGLIIGTLLLRHGVCVLDVCIDSSTFGSCVKFAGIVFTLYAAFTVVKSWFT